MRVNLTYGRTGCIVPGVIAALSFGFIAYLAGNTRVRRNISTIHLRSPAPGELAVLCGARDRGGPGFLVSTAAARLDFFMRHRLACARVP